MIVKTIMKKRSGGNTRRAFISHLNVLLCLAAFLGGSTVESHIRINDNGGYEDIVVSIGKEVPPIACQQLIQNIQAIFTSASEYLRKATDGRAYFHRVVIVVPPNWDTLACGKSLPVGSFTSRSAVNDAAIRIGTEHPIFGHLPWTQQSRGCGLPGDFISVGYHYIQQFNDTENTIGHSGSNANDNGNNDEGGGSVNYGRNYGNTGSGYTSSSTKSGYNSVPTERAFVREWAKFRYGVFEEIGFANDPIYPVSYMETRERKATACTNSPIRGNWSIGCDESAGSGGNGNGYYNFPYFNNNGGSQHHRSSSNNNNNMSCFFTPMTGTNSHENDHITSSIMSFAQLKTVKLFCDSKTHNQKAPTKHNFLCDQKSTSDVIFAHPDFHNLPYRETNGPMPPPEFIVKQITQPRFVLLVEETGNMNLRDVWKFLKLAIRKFIKYDMPVGSQIGLITVNTNDVRVLANMTSLQNGILRRALADKLPNYPNVDSGGNISLRRGIIQAVEILKRNQQRAAGSVIILVSQGTVSNTDLEASLELLRQEEVTVAAIEYPSLGDGKISLIAEGTNGPHFTIRETGVGPTTHMSTFVQLINALMTIQKFFTEDVSSNWPIMIHQAEYKGDSRSYVEANFSFESSAAQTPAEFFIYTSNPNDPKINSVELTSPNGVKYTTQLSDLHDINVIKIDAVINEPGVWRYRIERLADSHQSHFVQVVTKTSSEDLTARLYTNIANLDKVANMTATPLILYVEVKQKKNSPVIDADVEAHIVTGNKKWTVRLLDNGNGDPDVTKGDGVYSRYFIVPSGVTTTQLEISARIVVSQYRSRYIVVSQPSSSPSGRLNGPGAEPCCGSILLPADPKQQYKNMPFGERSSNTVMLRISDVPPTGFYSPSRIGDLKLGRIDALEKNVTISWTAPGEDFDQGVTASYQVFYSPDKINENWALLQEIKADLEAGVEDNATVTMPYYGSFLVAIRAVDFYSKWGKMSNVIKVTVLEPPKEDHYSGHKGVSGGSSLFVKETTPPPADELTPFDLMLIIVCGVAFVLLLAGLVVILLYCRRIGSTHRKSTKNPGDTKIAAITDPKSPIHWSASELLGEHEKRHSMYGGSVSPQSEQNLKNGQCQTHELQIQHSNSIPNGHMHHQMQQTNNQTNNSHHPHPVNLNIMPNDYVGTNSSRSRSSPDSYDDPDSPTPIPVSVRHTRTSDYAICIDNTSSISRNNESNDSRNSVIGYCHPQHHPQHHHYQIPQNGGLVVANSGYNTVIGGGVHSGGSSSGSSSHHIPNRYSAHQNNSSPLPPPHNTSHLMHYDPDIQGSMSSVNSKKRNITMV